MSPEMHASDVGIICVLSEVQARWADAVVLQVERQGKL